MYLGYFDLKEVSNSDLTALARLYNALPDNRAELEDIFNFGSLVDAMLSETERLRYHSYELAQEDGTFFTYTPDVWLQAEELVRQCLKDPVLRLIVKQMIGQYVFIRRLVFMYEGEEQTIDARCKFDGFSKALQMGAEYKTTSCTTLKQFREAVSHFHWDRAGAWYMDLARIPRHWIIGISKVNGKVFKIAVDRESEIYKTGVLKYSFWANRWNLLITPLQPKIITL